MNLLIISASQRVQSESAKVANYLSNNSEQFSDIRHIELCKINLPLWDGEESSKEDTASDWSKIHAQLLVADAIVLVTPEWGGTASPLLKNLLMMCASADIGHKPVLLVSVVSGISGAYPIAELRMNAFSNNKLVVIPDHLIIRNVENVLNEHCQEISQRDQSLRHRIGYSLHTLHHYGQALKNLRTNLQQNVYHNEHLYSYGM